MCHEHPISNIRHEYRLVMPCTTIRSRLMYIGYAWHTRMLHFVEIIKFPFLCVEMYAGRYDRILPHFNLAETYADGFHRILLRFDEQIFAMNTKSLVEYSFEQIPFLEVASYSRTVT